MILDACFEVPKLEDFQILFDIRNLEPKMSQHVRRTFLWSVTLKVPDMALIWTLTPANNKFLYMQNLK